LALRPEPGASATAAAAARLGLAAISAPLFTVRAVDWEPPEDLPDALLLTSANAVRLGGPKLAKLTALPVYAVGEATARAARAAGFQRVIAGDAGVDALAERARADGIGRWLHLAGREHRRPVPPPTTETRIVYAADAAERLPEAAMAALPQAVALLHSPRAAGHYRKLAEQAGFPLAALVITAISPAAAEAAGEGWRAVAVADRPDDAALLAAAAKLCDQ
ncbi:MAG TPA: uroporphyrinogen-III synthase, partial [Sphingomonas sp.]|nr:uroporphyrinogen-III synthase [Sphingomonas sp.]